MAAQDDAFPDYCVAVELKHLGEKGKGIVAKAFIPKGSKVWDATKDTEELLTEAELRSRLSSHSTAEAKELMRHVYCHNGQLYRVISDSKYTNHAQSPTTGSAEQLLKAGGQVPKDHADGDTSSTYALVDIQLGDEITEDYANYESLAFYEELCIEHGVISTSKCVEMFSKPCPISIQRRPVAALDDCEQALRSDGAVILQGVFDADMVAALKQEHDKNLSELDALLVDMEQKESTYLHGFGDAKKYAKQKYWPIEGADALDLGPGRLDFTYKMDQGIFADPAFHAPPPVAELARRLLKCDYAHFAGAVPSREKSDPGAWHRDTYSLFDNSTLDTQLPPYYLTVLVALNEITDELGPTQLHLGSHRCTDEDSKACPLANACPMQPGDALIFDGRCVHRGLANGSSDLRRVLYLVWHKKWYNDYADYYFAPGFSVCDPDAA